MIPVSTAMFDPKWYHDNDFDGRLFWDKNGVINGLRCYQLIFNSKDYQNWCSDTCEYRGTGGCPYLTAYKKMLGMVSWSDLLDFFKQVITYVVNHNCDWGNVDKYNICLIVYETPSAVCSERTVLKEWVKENGYDLVEWQKGEDCCDK